MKAVRVFLILVSMLPAVFIQSGVLVPAPPGPKTALDWFRRADSLTNIRMPGSAPFHMRVTFHAYPGIDFAPPGKSTIVTGDGVYEEWWVSPERWRREITLGTYHAVEVRADGVRRFQASSDYEPSRVLMLLRALLYPIPRYLVEPELEDKSTKPLVGRPSTWKTRHLTAGGLAYTELTFRADAPPSFSYVATYDLLPSGLPVRLISQSGLVTTWQDQGGFGGKAVPAHFAVRALGRDLVTASVTIESPGAAEAELFHLPGGPADACMTLRPFDGWDLPAWPEMSHIDTPRIPASSIPPPGVEVLTSGVVDRQGMARDGETSGILQDQRWMTNEEQGVVTMNARAMVEVWSRNRYLPALLDGSPCEFQGILVLGRPTITFSGGR